MDNRKYIFWLVLSLGFYVVWINVAPKLFPGIFKPAVEAPANVPAADDLASDNPPLESDAPAPAAEPTVEPAAEPTESAEPTAEPVAEAQPQRPLQTHAPRTVTLGAAGYEKGYLITVTLTTAGGSIESLELNDPRYTTLDRKQKFRLLGHAVDWETLPGGLLRMPRTLETPVDLIDKQLEAYDTKLRDVHWNMVTPAVGEPVGDEVVFNYTSPDGALEVVKTYRIHPVANPNDANPAAYLLDIDLKLHNHSAGVVSPVYIVQGPTGIPIENEPLARILREVKVGTLSPSGAVTPIHLAASEVFSQTVKAEAGGKAVDTWNEPVQYAGIDVQYFGSLILPLQQQLDTDDDGQADQTIEFVEPQLMYGNEKKKRNSDVSVLLNSRPVELAAGQAVTHKFQLFAGPKRPDLLDPIRAKEVIQFGNIPFIGWLPPFSLNPYVAHFIMWLLSYLHDSINLPYAVCIIAITIAVRGVMFPLSVRQAAQAEKMKILAPEMKKIQERYKDKPEEYAKAIGEFNRKNNANPLYGCLPMLLQMPVFFGLYGALGQAVDLRLAKFLWIDNLAGQDALFHLPFTVPWFGWNEFNLLPIMAVALFMIQAKVMTPPATSEDQEFTQKMQMAMMLAIGFAFYTVPAGLCVYIIVSSGWGLAERFLIKRFWPHIYDQKVATDGGDAASGGGGGSAAPTAPRAPNWFERLLAAADDAKSTTSSQASARGDSNRKKKPKRF